MNRLAEVLVDLNTLAVLIGAEPLFIEWRASELYRQTARIGKKRSKLCKVRLIKENLNKLIWKYHVVSKGGRSRGWNSVYAINVDKTLKEGKKISNPKNWHILVNCKCPAFVFWGTEFLAERNKYLYGKAIGTLELPKRNVVLAPRTPDEASWSSSLTCKHITAVLPILLKRWEKESKKILSVLESIKKEKKRR